jgi:CRP/FNR family nitrogen fixation transcriptional regulator
MSVSLASLADRGRTGTAAPLPWMVPGAAETTDDFCLGMTGQVMHVAPDRRIYQEGDDVRSVYKVASGVVRTCKFLSDGRRQIDGFHLPGDLFGLESGTDHRLTAEAVTDCMVISYRRRGMEAQISQDNATARLFFIFAMNSLSRTRDHALLLGRGSAAQKLATFLLEIAARGANDHVVELPMGRQDIADYLGLTIETVSRTLSHLDRGGVIHLASVRRVILKDLDALNDLAG